MTRSEIPTGLLDLNSAVDELMQTFGRWQALRAILLQFFRKKGRPPDSITALNDHYRKDVGLPPAATPPPRWTPPRF